jgi:hypothetical protein
MGGGGQIVYVAYILKVSPNLLAWYVQFAFLMRSRCPQPEIRTAMLTIRSDCNLSLLTAAVVVDTLHVLLKFADPRTLKWVTTLLVAEQKPIPVVFSRSETFITCRTKLSSCYTAG